MNNCTFIFFFTNPGHMQKTILNLKILALSLEDRVTLVLFNLSKPWCSLCKLDLSDSWCED